MTHLKGLMYATLCGIPVVPAESLVEGPAFRKGVKVHADLLRRVSCPECLRIIRKHGIGRGSYAR